MTLNKKTLKKILPVTKELRTKMAKSSTERAREYRTRKNSEGLKCVTIWLDPETLAMMRSLREAVRTMDSLNRCCWRRETNAVLIARAIRALYDAALK